MSIQTRLITVTLFDTDGSPLENARVVITLVGLGNEPGGAVAPGSTEQFTDANGQTIFELWENNGAYSNTYYEIQSWHPTKATAIHRREKFRVPDYDAELEELIALALANVNPNQELLDQVSAAKDSAIASAGSASSSAQSAAASALASSNSATASASNAASASSSATAAQASEQQASDASDSAGISATSAADAAIAANNSATIALGHADSASGSALDASNSATVAGASASSASDSSDSAAASAATATEQAGIATTKAGESSASAASASDSATTATSQAGVATTQAGIATTKAGEASASATAAASSASDAEGFAEAAAAVELGSVLTGFSPSSSDAVTSTDTLMDAIEKLQAKATLTGAGEKLPILPGIDLNEYTTPGQRFLIYSTTTGYTNHPLENFSAVNKSAGLDVIEIEVISADGYTYSKSSYTWVAQIARQIGVPPIVRVYTSAGTFGAWQYLENSQEYSYPTKTTFTLNAGTYVTSGYVTYWRQGSTTFITGEIVLGALDGVESITAAEGNVWLAANGVEAIPLCLADVGNGVSPRLHLDIGSSVARVISDAAITPGTYYFSHRSSSN